MAVDAPNRMFSWIRTRLRGRIRQVLLTPPLSWLLGLPYRMRLLERRLDGLERDQQRTQHSGDFLVGLQATRLVIEACRPSEPPLISVITPTHNRLPWLKRCINSMRHHNYNHWEMVVALDRCDDGSSEFLECISRQDSRIVTVASDRPGVAAARNTALKHAAGDILVYLDDDNCFAMGWLSAVAWAFENHPWAEVLYGALVIDNPGRVDPNRPGPYSYPILIQRPFRRSQLIENNITDMGCLAHRRGLPEATFDETLSTMHDWDFFGRLVSHRDPLVLPHPALIYQTDAPNRLSKLHQDAPEIKIIRDRLRRLYPNDPDRAAQP